jgi:hypothetical protein
MKKERRDRIASMITTDEGLARFIKEAYLGVLIPPTAEEARAFDDILNTGVQHVEAGLASPAAGQTASLWANVVAAVDRVLAAPSGILNLRLQRAAAGGTFRGPTGEAPTGKVSGPLGVTVSGSGAGILYGFCADPDGRVVRVADGTAASGATWSRKFRIEPTAKVGRRHVLFVLVAAAVEDDAQLLEMVFKGTVVASSARTLDS